MKRKATGLKNYDYSSEGAYFVTICIRNRILILSEVVKTEPDTLYDVRGIWVGEGLAPPEYQAVLKPCGVIVKTEPDTLYNVRGIWVGEGLAPPGYQIVLKLCGVIVKELLKNMRKGFDWGHL